MGFSHITCTAFEFCLKKPCPKPPQTQDYASFQPNDASPFQGTRPADFRNKFWENEQTEMPGDAALGPRDRAVHISALTEVHRANTFVPKAPMTAIAATLINPATKAYSKTSPPDSSNKNRDSLLIVPLSVLNPLNLMLSLIRGNLD
jgi:hypothetical protein